MTRKKIWLDYDQDALDAEYNNQRTVTDYNAVMREWAQASAHGRETCETHTDLAYGPHPRARIDFYPAGGDGTTVIFFHGGFWRSFDKTGLAFLAPAFVQAGISIAFPNYPLAPEADMATIVHHAGEAATWIVDHADELSIDASKLWIAGHSAGAHLAVMTALSTAEGKIGNDFAGCCAISGIYELEPIRRSYLNETLRLSERDVAACSPINRRVAGLPLVAAVGAKETDEFCRQTSMLVDHWRDAGGMCWNTLLPDTDHYEAVRRLARPGDTLFRAVVSAMRWDFPKPGN